MRTTVTVLGLLLLTAQSSDAEEVRSLVQVRPTEVVASSRLSGFSRGLIDARAHADLRYVRSTTVGQRPDGGLVIGIGYALQPSAGRAVAVHVGRASTEDRVLLSRGQIKVHGRPRGVQIAGGISAHSPVNVWIDSRAAAADGVIRGETWIGSRRSN